MITLMLCLASCSSKDDVSRGGAVMPIVGSEAIAKPWKPNDKLVRMGEKLYQTSCAICHGSKADGDGPASSSLSPAARDLIKGDWTKGGSSVELFVTLQKGIAGGSMASFKHLSKFDRWALVQYVRSVTKNKPIDDPAQLEAFAQSAKAD